MKEKILPLLKESQIRYQFMKTCLTISSVFCCILTLSVESHSKVYHGHYEMSLSRISDIRMKLGILNKAPDQILGNVKSDASSTLGAIGIGLGLSFINQTQFEDNTFLFNGAVDDAMRAAERDGARFPFWRRDCVVYEFGKIGTPLCRVHGLVGKSEKDFCKTSGDKVVCDVKIDVNYGIPKNSESGRSKELWNSAPIFSVENLIKDQQGTSELLDLGTAIKRCADKQMRLPSIYELVNYAEVNGAKGFVPKSKDFLGMDEFTHNTKHNRYFFWVSEGKPRIINDYLDLVHFAFEVTDYVPNRALSSIGKVWAGEHGLPKDPKAHNFDFETAEIEYNFKDVKRSALCVSY